MRKAPGMAGTPAIRVMKIGEQYEWFSDPADAMFYVQANWVAGREMSARVCLDGRVWEPIFMIEEDGQMWLSPLYHNLVARKPIDMGKATELTLEA